MYLFRAGRVPWHVCVPGLPHVRPDRRGQLHGLQRRHVSPVRGAATGHGPGHAARPRAAGVSEHGRGLHLPLGGLRHAAGEVELLTNFSEVSQCSVKVKTVSRLLKRCKQ